MKPKAVKENTWLKNQQRLQASDVAESFISVTNVKRYIYCPRLIYFDHVLNVLQCPSKPLKIKFQR